MIDWIHAIDDFNVFFKDTLKVCVLRVCNVVPFSLCAGGIDTDFMVWGWGPQGRTNDCYLIRLEKYLVKFMYALYRNAQKGRSRYRGLS